MVTEDIRTQKTFAYFAWVEEQVNVLDFFVYVDKIGYRSETGGVFAPPEM